MQNCEYFYKKKGINLTRAAIPVDELTILQGTRHQAFLEGFLQRIEGKKLAQNDTQSEEDKSFSGEQISVAPDAFSRLFDPKPSVNKTKGIPKKVPSTKPDAEQITGRKNNSAIGNLSPATQRSLERVYINAIALRGKILSDPELLRLFSEYSNQELNGILPGIGVKKIAEVEDSLKKTYPKKFRRPE